MICGYCGSPFGMKSGPTCDYRRKTPAAVHGGWDAPCECAEYRDRMIRQDRRAEILTLAVLIGLPAAFAFMGLWIWW